MANGGCQQLCLYRGRGQRACACAHGMLAEDGASCREYAGYLLYSERTILKSIHLSDERNLNAPVQPFEDPEHMKNVIALAFDYRAGTSPGTPNRIFFSDIHFGNIQQINDDGSRRITIVESEPRPQVFPGSGTWGGEQHTLSDPSQALYPESQQLQLSRLPLHPRSYMTPDVESVSAPIFLPPLVLVLPSGLHRTSQRSLWSPALTNPGCRHGAELQSLGVSVTWVSFLLLPNLSLLSCMVRQDSLSCCP